MFCWREWIWKLRIHFRDFSCNCSKDRVRKALISIGREELQSMIDDGKEIEVNCHFCNKNYNFTVDELKEMIQD